MRIQRQLSLGFVGIVAVSGVATSIVFASQAIMVHAGSTLIDESEVSGSAASLELAVGKLGEGASLFAREERALGRQRAAEGRAELALSLESLSRLTHDPFLAAELDELKLLSGAAQSACARVLLITGAPRTDGLNPPERLEVALAVLETRVRALGLKADLFADHARARAQAMQRSAQRFGRTAERVTAGLLVGALGLALVVAVVLARRITAPIEQLAVAARRVGEGDLSAQAAGGRSDELGELARVFNQMANDLGVAQARLVRSERLAAIGELAVTMQHELNNPLQGILGAIALVLDDRAHGLGDSPREALTMIRDEVAKMSSLIAKLGRISEPVSKTYLRDIRMLDLDKSAPS